MQAACCTWAWWVIWIYTKIAGNRRTQRIHLRHPSKPIYVDLLGRVLLFEKHPLCTHFLPCFDGSVKPTFFALMIGWIYSMPARYWSKDLSVIIFSRYENNRKTKPKPRKKEDINNGSYSLSMYRWEFEHVHNCSQSWSPISCSWFTLKCKKKLNVRTETIWMQK